MEQNKLGTEHNQNIFIYSRQEDKSKENENRNKQLID